MASARITLSGYVTSILTGSKTIGPIDVDAASALAKTDTVVLQAGDNIIAVPTGATAVIAHLPSGNTSVVTLKGDAGDVGIQISKEGPVLLAFDAAGLPASIILNSVGIQSSPTEFLFI